MGKKVDKRLKIRNAPLSFFTAAIWDYGVPEKAVHCLVEVFICN